MNQKIKKALDHHGVNLTFLTILSALTCWFYWVPNLSGDDWYFVNSAVTMQYQWLDFRIPRPLEGTFYKIFYQFWGINIPFYYASTWLVWLLSCLIFYLFLSRLFSSSRPLPLFSSLVLCIYPVYQLRMWVTSIHLHFVLLLTILFAWFLYEFKTRFQWRWWALAVIALVLSLLDYEGQLGICLLWATFLAFAGHLSWRHRFGLASPAFVGLAYIVWRFLLLSQTRQPTDTPSLYLVNAQQIFIKPLVIFERLIEGAKVLLLGWMAPWFMFNIRPDVLLPLFLIIILLLLLTVMVMIWNYTDLKNLPQMQIDSTRVQNLLKFFFLAAVFTAAAYLPFVFIYTPSLDFFTSRVNIFAMLGASVMVAVLIWSLASIAKKPQIQWINSTILLLFFLAAGSLFQFEVQVESHRAWCDQADIWAQLKSMAPAFTNDTFIGIVMKQSHYGDSLISRDILITPWEVDSAVRLLYNNQALNGSVIYLNRPDLANLSKDGITVSWPARFEPISSAAFFLYDENLHQLRLVKSLKELNIDGSNNYAPLGHILPGTIDNNQYRSLIPQCPYD